MNLLELLVLFLLLVLLVSLVLLDFFVLLVLIIIGSEILENSPKWLERKAVEQQIGNLNDEIENLKTDKKKLRSGVILYCVSTSNVEELTVKNVSNETEMKYI